MKLGEALEEVRSSTSELAHALRTVGERHASQQDVFHMSHLLSTRMEDLAASLSTMIERYGERADQSSHAGVLQSLGERARRAVAETTADMPQSGSLLLRDLRELHTASSSCAMDWTVARQGALAVRDQELVIATSTGFSETTRVVKWLTTRIKESSPQVLMGAD